MDMLEGKKLLNKYQQTISTEDALKHAKTIIYYFGASWCNTCQGTLNTLLKVHKENRSRNTGFEVIYVSLDTNQTDFIKHFKQQGEWFAVPLEGDLREELKQKYGVTNIPFVIVVRKDGQIITKSGKKELEEKGVNVLVTWD